MNVFTFGIPFNIVKLYFYIKNSDNFGLTIKKISITILNYSFKIFFKKPTYPLRPITPNNASSSCITAAAGTGISQNLLLPMTVIINLGQKDFTAYAVIIRKTFLDQAYAHCPSILHF